MLRYFRAIMRLFSLIGFVLAAICLFATAEAKLKAGECEGVLRVALLPWSA